jgi:hypothetical protein
MNKHSCHNETLTVLKTLIHLPMVDKLDVLVVALCITAAEHDLKEDDLEEFSNIAAHKIKRVFPICLQAVHNFGKTMQ